MSGEPRLGVREVDGTDGDGRLEGVEHLVRALYFHLSHHEIYSYISHNLSKTKQGSDWVNGSLGPLRGMRAMVSNGVEEGENVQGARLCIKSGI